MRSDEHIMGIRMNQVNQVVECLTLQYSSDSSWTLVWRQVVRVHRSGELQLPEEREPCAVCGCGGETLGRNAPKASKQSKHKSVTNRPGHETDTGHKQCPAFS